MSKVAKIIENTAKRVASANSFPGQILKVGIIYIHEHIYAENLTDERIRKLNDEDRALALVLHQAENARA